MVALRIARSIEATVTVPRFPYRWPRSRIPSRSSCSTLRIEQPRTCAASMLGIASARTAGRGAWRSSRVARAAGLHQQRVEFGGKGIHAVDQGRVGHGCVPWPLCNRRDSLKSACHEEPL